MLQLKPYMICDKKYFYLGMRVKTKGKNLKPSSSVKMKDIDQRSNRYVLEIWAMQEGRMEIDGQLKLGLTLCKNLAVC